MFKFKTKKIKNIESLGEKLKKHREVKGVKLLKVSRLIQVNYNFLKMVESGDYKNLPPDVYSQNFLKTYAEFLELNPYMVKDLYLKEKKFYWQTQEKKENKDLSLKERLFNIFLNPSFLKYSFLIILGAVIFSYLGFSVNKIFSPPELVIEQPENNLVISQQSLNIKGKTDKEVELTVNGRQVVSDKAGQFQVDLDLQTGLNIIKISAKKKHSRENIIYRKVIVEKDLSSQISLK